MTRIAFVAAIATIGVGAAVVLVLVLVPDWLFNRAWREYEKRDDA